MKGSFGLTKRTHYSGCRNDFEIADVWLQAKHLFGQQRWFCALKPKALVGAVTFRHSEANLHNLPIFGAILAKVGCFLIN